MIRGTRKNQDRKKAKRAAASATKAAARREAKMAGYKGKVSMVDPTCAAEPQAPSPEAMRKPPA
jgi:hypothetical protein